MPGYSVEVDGHHFDVPAHMLGFVDRTTSWGTGLEQQELGFAQRVVEAFGTADRVDEILGAAASRRAEEGTA